MISIVIALSSITISLFVIVVWLMKINSTLENAFLWHKDWMHFEKQYKKRFYELQTSLESAKRELKNERDKEKASHRP